MRVFKEGKRFFKGNTHCHTTRSDGRESPESVRKLYQSMGYDFLFLTDHRRLSEQAMWEKNMLTLPGLEMDFTLPGEALHLIGLGMRESFMQDPAWHIGPQECIDAMRRHGGRAILAHPHWSLNTLSTLGALKNVTAAEIYNTVSGVPWNGARADSSEILDVAAAHGAVYAFVAADDSHYYNGEAGFSYSMVQAEELGQDALLSALDQGLFYSSQGPDFVQLEIENGKLTVTCSPVDTVVFYSNLVYSSFRCQRGNGLTQAEYPLQNSMERYVRVQLIDAQGKSAWSNPIIL